MRPDYDAAWNSNKQAPQPGTSDYDRAMQQREAAERRAASAQRQQQAQMDAGYRKSQQQADAARRVFERNTQAEVRHYEGAQRAKAKADNDLQRARDRNARAQEQLDRRQAADRERNLRFQRGLEVADARNIDMTRSRRIRAEAQFGQQFDALRGRSSRTLTPSGYLGAQRQATLLQNRAAQFQGLYGRAPAGAGGLGGFVGSLGSFNNTYAAQNISNLGARGQRAAEGREWVGLARIEQELRRIERINQAMLTNETKATAEQKINAQRNLNTVQEARGRIGAGRSGSSAFMNAAGSTIGAAGLLLKNPMVDMAVAAVTAAITSPFIISGVANKVMGLSKPYNDLRKDTAAIGRAGGFDGMDLQNQLFPGGPAPQWMKDLGVTTESGRGILKGYGIAPRSAEEGLGIIQDVRRASLSQFMGLDDNQLAGSGRLARMLGIVGGGGHMNSLWAGGGSAVGSAETTYTTDLSKYFATLQKVMASATAQGLDHATTLQNVEGLLRITAGSGAASVNAGSLANFWGQMTSTGLPGMRSGEGVATALSGINSAFDNIGVGGAPAQNTMMMSYFNRNGGMPKTEGALQKMLGMSDKEWGAVMGDPGQKQMIQNYLGAADKNPAFALSYLSPFLKGRPDLMNRFFEGSTFGDANSTIKPMLKGIVTGAGYDGGVGMSVGTPALAGVTGAAPTSTAGVNAAIRAAANATGIDENILKGLAAKESSMNPGATNGNAAGLFQLMPGARNEMGLADENKFDPLQNATAGAGYLKKMYALFPEGDADRTEHALEAYEWGPMHAAEIARGGAPDIYKAHARKAISYGAQYANRTPDQFASEANTEALGITASKDAWENAGKLVGQAPGDAVATFSAAVVTGTTAMEGFIRSLIDGSAAIKYNASLPSTQNPLLNPGGVMSPFDQAKLMQP